MFRLSSSDLLKNIKKKYFFFFFGGGGGGGGGGELTWYWEKRWLFSIGNGAKIRPLEMGRKSPVSQFVNQYLSRDQILKVMATANILYFSLAIWCMATSLFIKIKALKKIRYYNINLKNLNADFSKYSFI